MTRRCKRCIPGIIFVLMIFASTQAQAQKPSPTEKIFQEGKKVYQRQCLVCHGATGQGEGSASYLLYPKPGDFSRNEFRLVSTNDMQVTDEDLFKTISCGMPGSAMPSWNHLSENERWALVYYVRYLAELNNFKQSGEITDEMLKKEVPWLIVQKVLTKEIDPESLVKVTPEPKVTEERLKLGRELFVKGCVACHGLQGRGDGQQMMKDSAGLPLKPRDITAGIFKGSSSSEDLYYRIAGGIPGSPMPGYQAAFTDEEIWNIIHYVQTLSTPEAEKRSRVQHLRFIAKRAAEVSADPLAEQWSKVEPVFVALMPLWWRDERIEGLQVRALHDGKKIAFHLSWKDTTKDNSTVAVQSFSDGVAIQFSEGKDLPTFAMGGAESPVTIWNWKAAWQEDLRGRKDIETAYPHTAVDWYESQKNYELGSHIEMADTKTRFHDPRFITGWGAGNPLSDPERKFAGEESMAKGLGTLTAQSRDPLIAARRSGLRIAPLSPEPKLEPIEVRGVWKDGAWQAVFVRDLKTSEKGALEFRPGESLSVAFAAWDGSKKDRNGQKEVSIWNELVLEEV